MGRAHMPRVWPQVDILTASAARERERRSCSSSQLEFAHSWDCGCADALRVCGRASPVEYDRTIDFVFVCVTVCVHFAALCTKEWHLPPSLPLAF
jgi:hypothetical protein